MLRNKPAGETNCFAVCANGLKSRACECGALFSPLHRHKEKSSMDFIICTEDVNRHGYRVLLSGARLDNFKKNPVMLYDHNDWRNKPIGRWENLRVQDGKLVATAVFAEGDEHAQQVRNLCEQGALSATSIGMVPVTFSSDPVYLLSGQSRETVIEWELLEVSIVPVPANPHTVKLRLSNNSTEGVLPAEISKTEDAMNISEIATTLGLQADATPEQVQAAVQALRHENQALILSLGEQQGVVKEENRPIWAELAAKDPKNTLALMQSLKGQQPEAAPEAPAATQPAKQEMAAPAAPAGEEVTLQKIFSLVQRNGGQPASDQADNPDTWNYDQWSRRDPDGLLRMKRQEPEKYAKLSQSYAKAN